jgi:quinol monooxygenase YgiN
MTQMMIQTYQMTAIAGQEDDLRSALVALAAAVRKQPGCISAKVYADVTDASAFLFAEEWVSREDHKQAGQALGREAFAPVMAAAEGRPDVRSLVPA